MIINKLQIDGIKELLPNKFHDNRGYFMETFKNDIFEKFTVRQENTSMSLKMGTLRGIHLQVGKHAQSKLVTCIKGKIMDIYVDLRKESKTFGSWGSIILTEIKNNQIFIPKGFGHGFITLTDDCVVSYKVDQYYSKESEYTVAWNDKFLNIDWKNSNPIISDKDLKGRSITEYCSFVDSINA